MQNNTVPIHAREAILQDAARRDPTTARRYALLTLLWHERCLSRAQLIVRIEFRLGKGCFGQSAWVDNFYRDMRVVKQALQSAGFELAYSRRKPFGGYYLRGQPALSAELSQLIKSAAGEVDPRQIEIYRRLSPAERFRQGCAISDTARKVVAYRIRQANPALSLIEANRLALQRSYAP